MGGKLRQAERVMGHLGGPRRSVREELCPLAHKHPESKHNLHDMTSKLYLKSIIMLVHLYISCYMYLSTGTFANILTNKFQQVPTAMVSCNNTI